MTAQQLQTPAAPAHPLPQPAPIVARPHNDLASIAESVEATSLTEDQRERLFNLIEKAAKDSKSYTVALAYLKEQTKKDGKIYATGAYRLGEIALYRLAAFAAPGLVCEYLQTLTQIGLPAQSILQRFLQAAHYYFGGRVESAASTDPEKPRLYSKDQSILVVKRPRNAHPTLSLKLDHDPAVLRAAKAALNADKRTVFKYEYRPLQGELDSLLVTLCKTAARLVDALEYAPKNSDKPNKAALAMQDAIRADLAKIGLTEAAFCQTFTAPLVQYRKQLDKKHNK